MLERKFNAVIFDVEGSDSHLDISAGIDYLLKFKDGGCIGVAMRIVSYCNYQNFSIKPHEIQYMKLAKEKDYLCAKIICQAFVIAGKLRSYGLITADNLLQAEEKMSYPVIPTRARDTSFCLFDWKKMKQANINFYCWHEDE